MPRLIRFIGTSLIAYHIIIYQILELKIQTNLLKCTLLITIYIITYISIYNNYKQFSMYFKIFHKYIKKGDKIEKIN